MRPTASFFYCVISNKVAKDNKVTKDLRRYPLYFSFHSKLGALTPELTSQRVASSWIFIPN